MGEDNGYRFEFVTEPDVEEAIRRAEEARIRLLLTRIAQPVFYPLLRPCPCDACRKLAGHDGDT